MPQIYPNRSNKNGWNYKEKVKTNVHWANFHRELCPVAFETQDVMLDLRKQRPHDASEYMELGMVTQTLQKRTGHEAEKFSKKW